MKAGCILDLEFQSLRTTPPKLGRITELLQRHPDAKALILSSFTEVILVAERVSVPFDKVIIKRVLQVKIAFLSVWCIALTFRRLLRFIESST